MLEIFLLSMIVSSLNAFTPALYGFPPIDNNPVSHPTITWYGGQYIWPCSSTKNMYKSSGKYISKNVITTRGVIIDNEVILASPRYRPGVPATLVKVHLKHGTCEADLQPWPCWSMQEEGNCNSLQSVVDVFLDANKILWVLDVGVVNTLETPIRRCPPKIIAFNVKTGNILKVITLEGLVCNTSRLQYLVVDYSSDGRCFVYVSDAAARAIIVYDVQASRGFRVVLPRAVTMGCTKRDVLYLALSRKSCGTTILYFTYLSSKRLFAINTEYLRSGNTQGRITDVGLKNKRLVLIGTDNGSAIFFRYEGQTEIYRWDTTTCFQTQNFKVVHRSPTCQLATHVMADYRFGVMRVLESNFPDYIQNTVGCGAVQHLSIMHGCV